MLVYQRVWKVIPLFNMVPIERIAILLSCCLTWNGRWLQASLWEKSPPLQRCVLAKASSLYGCHTRYFSVPILVASKRAMDTYPFGLWKLYYRLESGGSSLQVVVFHFMIAGLVFDLCLCATSAFHMCTHSHSWGTCKFYPCLSLNVVHIIIPTSSPCLSWYVAN